jgi:dTDP-4-dehydrorhamnose 3,5-epimerase-like enzyme
MKERANLLHGGEFEDARGKLIFFNDFDLTAVKRFYIIEHPDIEVIRAWQGHQKEEKWFYVLDGAFKLVLVQPDDWENPSLKLNTEEFVLEASQQKLLHVPGGYANGFKALKSKSRIIVFSSFTVEESAKDNFRFDKNDWYNWE